MQGPEVRLGPTAAVTLGMAMHELATNAATYGALSVPEGGVEITWRFDLEGGSLPALDLLWRERNGPPTKPSGHRGSWYPTGQRRRRPRAGWRSEA